MTVLSFSPFRFQVYIVAGVIHIEHFTQMGNVRMWEHSDCRAFLMEELTYGAKKNVISRLKNQLNPVICNKHCLGAADPIWSRHMVAINQQLLDQLFFSPLKKQDLTFAQTQKPKECAQDPSKQRRGTAVH